MSHLRAWYHGVEVSSSFECDVGALSVEISSERMRDIGIGMGVRASLREDNAHASCSVDDMMCEPPRHAELFGGTGGGVARLTWSALRRSDRATSPSVATRRARGTESMWH
jgi:hypothetical protein